METIEQLLESKDIRITAMRLLIYKFLAEKEIAVTLSDIENAFEKADRTTLYNCNETICLTNHKIPQIKAPDGFVSENVNLVVKGICDKCSG